MKINLTKEEKDMINTATDKLDEALEVVYDKGFKAGKEEGFIVAMALMKNAWNDIIGKVIPFEELENVYDSIETISTLDEIGLK